MSRLNLVLVGIGVGLCATGAADDVPAPEQQGVQAAANAYVEAFNQHNAAAVGQLWAENGVYTDRETGARTVGRAAIQADLEETFTAHPAIRLQFDAGEVRLIRPDVAQAEATATVTIPDEDPSVVSVSAIFVRQGDRWLLDSAEESPLPQPESAFTALRPLEFLIGDWRDESDEVTATSSFRWGAEGAFLIRSFATESADAPLTEGTQVIGWDPRARQIRSWTFNSDGSFGEAVWSRSGDEWLIKSIQVLVDGAAASGAYVVSPIDHDTMTVHLIGHEVAGEPQPASVPVRVVRVAAGTAATPAVEQAAPTGGAK